MRCRSGARRITRPSKGWAARPAANADRRAALLASSFGLHLPAVPLCRPAKHGGIAGHASVSGPVWLVRAVAHRLLKAAVEEHQRQHPVAGRCRLLPVLAGASIDFQRQLALRHRLLQPLVLRPRIHPRPHTPTLSVATARFQGRSPPTPAHCPSPARKATPSQPSAPGVCAPLRQ